MSQLDGRDLEFVPREAVISAWQLVLSSFERREISERGFLGGAKY